MTPNLSSLLLFAAVTAPMLTVLLLAVRPWRDAVMRATPVAALPALLLALAGPTGAKLNLPWLVQHPVLELDAVGRVFLGFTGVLYLASGWYACGYLVKDANPARFHLFFLLAMAGNFGLIWRATFRPSTPRSRCWVWPRQGWSFIAATRKPHAPGESTWRWRWWARS